MILEDPSPGQVVDEEVVLVVGEGDAVCEVKVVKQSLALLCLGVVSVDELDFIVLEYCGRGK